MILITVSTLVQNTYIHVVFNFLDFCYPLVNILFYVVGHVKVILINWPEKNMDFTVHIAELEQISDSYCIKYTFV